MKVNHEEGLKNSILTMMVKSSSPVSGIEMGEKLGISRVAVWKHIQGLVEEGYTITGSRAGYSLEAEPDYVTSSNYDFSGEPVFARSAADSTMQMAEKYTQGGTAFFVARNQLRGRGRTGKTWESPGGGLYFTMSFEPDFPAAYANMYLIAAGMAAAEVINRNYDAGCRFSWPNDLYCGNKKLGGLLIEVEGESESPTTCRLGLGVNIESHDRTDYPNAACLINYTDAKSEKPTVKKVFSLLKPVLSKAVKQCTPEQTRLDWEKLSEELGTSMILRNKGYIISGMSLTGALILEESSGALWETAPGWKVIGPYRH